MTGEPDAEHVALRGVTDPALDGSLVFSPSTADLVVVATGLIAPPAGQEYRCWVEVDGQRQPVGRMFFSDELAYWAGDVPALSGLTGAATFGVSLVDASTSQSSTTDPVLARRAVAAGSGLADRAVGDRRPRRSGSSSTGSVAPRHRP